MASTCWRSLPCHRHVGPPRPARRPARLVVRSAVVGVDLGTSNSAVAVVEAGTARVLRDESGSNCVPSVVAITPYDQTVVGHEALAAGTDAANTFYSFKRLIGRKLEEVEEEAGRLLYAVGEGDRGEAAIYCPNLDDMLSPEELSGWVLQHLLGLAQRQLQEAVTGAVVTVPAHFNERQLGATRQAASLAGLPERQVLLLQEPVAAALAYGINGGTDGDTVLVLDVGGGTYDVSILQAFEGILEVLGTAGDSNLGGNDMDAALADWLMEQSGVADRQWALAAAETAKVQLSSQEEASIPLPGGGSVTLTQQAFEQVSAPLFKRMAAPLELLGRQLFVEWATEPAEAVPGRQALHANSGVAERQQAASSAGSGGGSSGAHDGMANSSNGSAPASQQQTRQGTDKWAPPPRRITRVVLVGQSTRLPAVQQFVERLTGVQPEMGVDPAEAVALGAAIQAGVLLGEVGSVELMDGSYSVDLHDRATGFGSGGWEP